MITHLQEHIFSKMWSLLSEVTIFDATSSVFGVTKQYRYYIIMIIFSSYEVMIYRYFINSGNCDDYPAK